MTEDTRRSALSPRPAAFGTSRDSAASGLLTVDVLAVLVAVALPWSTSGVGILMALWLLALIPTLDPRALLRSLTRPASALPLALFVLAVLGTLWSDSPWPARLHGINPVSKLFAVPLLLYHFERSQRAIWVFAAFLISCALLMALSWIVLFAPELKLASTASPGVPVKNYIDQSQEFALCLFALAPFVLSLFHQRRFALAAACSALMLGFLGNMMFVVSARTALVYMPVMLGLFALLYERKSVEPMAAVTAPERTAAQHQSLLHFVGQGRWSDEEVLAKVREMVLPAIERHGPIEAWIIDDTGFPKKGRHSVGVARQYCGQLGKQDNCQVAVSLSLANHHASLPVAYRLYLPEDWAEDGDVGARRACLRRSASRPSPRSRSSRSARPARPALPRGVVLMDAGYGRNTELRSGISGAWAALCGRHSAETTVWAPGTGPLPPRAVVGPRPAAEADAPRSRASAGLGQGARASACRRRPGARSPGGKAPPSGCPRALRALRVRVAHRDYDRTESRPEEWLLIEWPKGEDEPTKYWLSTLPENIAFRDSGRCSPSCAGASSAIIRSSSRRSGSGILKGADGAASIITPRCASRLTDS